MVATLVLGTSGEIRGGSSPSTRTKYTFKSCKRGRHQVRISEETRGAQRCFKAHYEGYYKQHLNC
jgi:hypothetical protein